MTSRIDTKQLSPGAHLQDMLLMSLYDPSARMAMANTAEELGRRYRITREECDRFGLRSHQNAKAARDASHFDEELIPVTVREDGTLDPIVVKYDTHIMDDATLEGMARLRPAFEAGGVITAGNASAVVDGAAAMVLGREADALRHGCKPLCRHRPQFGIQDRVRAPEKSLKPRTSAGMAKGQLKPRRLAAEWRPVSRRPPTGPDCRFGDKAAPGLWCRPRSPHGLRRFLRRQPRPKQQRIEHGDHA